MYIATMTTDNFNFQALGAYEVAAKAAIFRGWVKHCRQMGIANEFKTVKDLDEWYGINVVKLEVNDCARDYEPMNVY